MRTRAHDWYDTKTNTPLYGIQIKISDKFWHYLWIEGKLAVYFSAEQRDEVRKIFSRFRESDVVAVSNFANSRYGPSINVPGSFLVDKMTIDTSAFDLAVMDAEAA